MFDRVSVSDGDVVDVSPSLSVRVIATPGHTFNHLSYALLADGARGAVFTGGSLLFASTGRPDPELADAAELRRRIHAGEWVVALRSRTAFSAAHLAGTLNFGVDGQFATYLGWVMPWGTPLTLLGESAEQVAEAQRELVRIGIERRAAAAAGDPHTFADDACLATLQTATLADLADVRANRDVVFLDVRRDLECNESHVVGGLHVPLHELLDRFEEIRPGEVWVHCADGYRASIASSVLASRGCRVGAVDDQFTNAADAGLELEHDVEVPA